MTTTQAIAKDPVQFVRLDGVMIEIPIGNIFFTDGAIGTNYVLDANSDKLPAYLAFLAKRGDLKPAPVPQISVLQATANAGGGGNRITIVVAPASDTTKVNITVTQTDIYESLTVGRLIAVLGDATHVVATNNGVLRVSVAPTTNAPDPVNGTFARDPGSTAAAPTWTIANTRPPAAPNPVTLVPKDVTLASGFGPQVTFKVMIENATPAAGGATFRLRVETSIAVSDIAFGGMALPMELDGFKYLVTFAGVGTGPYRLPSASTTSLQGGADASAATSATGTIFATA